MSPTTPAWLSPTAARWLVVLVALAAYANSLPNGFALDDNWFIVQNPVVTEARFADAFTERSWPGAVAGQGNYRPMVLTSFALEWSIWGSNPLGFHVVNVLAHAMVCLVLLALLGSFFALEAAFAGAVLFAVHPVHVEAVANVMGRSEIFAALAYLGACLAYLRTRGASLSRRVVGLLAIVILYALALGSKEMAVTLPAVLIALECFAPAERSLLYRLKLGLPVYLTTFALLGCYVVVRGDVLGMYTGSGVAAGLGSLGTEARIYTALSMWPQYARLLFFPVDLVADYGPAVLPIHSSVTPTVVLGGVLAAATVVLAVLLGREANVGGLPVAWFVITISPVSNLLIQADVFLAERTLYLPSVAVAIVAALVTSQVVSEQRRRVRRVAAGIGVTIVVLFLARTIDRNPSWMSTFVMLQTLVREHPESWRANAARAAGLADAGYDEDAAEAFALALALAPDEIKVRLDAAAFYRERGDVQRAEALLRSAISLAPSHPIGYRHLAELLLVQRAGREAHRVALEGLARVGADRELWGSVSEAYVLRGDLPAAARAREASVAAEPTAFGWARLAEVLEAAGDSEGATRARAEAAMLAALEGSGS